MPQQIPLLGAWSLADQENEVSLNEAAGWELIALKIDPDSAKNNQADFRRLDIGERPTRLRLRLKADPPPPNTEKLFDAALRVASEETEVTAYREQSTK